MDESKKAGKLIINRIAHLADAGHIDQNPQDEHKPAPFKQRYKKALADNRLSRNLLNFQRNWMPSRAGMFAEFKAAGVGQSGSASSEQANLASAPIAPVDERDFQTMRHKLALIKDEVIDHQEEYLEAFKQHARANGIIVHEADTTEQLNQIVLELCQQKGISTVVKSKTMVSEETGLNHVLEDAGIKPVETDLGEWIAQLSHERPSHMVLPVIHKSRQQVGALLSKVTGRQIDSENVTEQVGVIRTELRQDFLNAGMGISGR